MSESIRFKLSQIIARDENVNLFRELKAGVDPNAVLDFAEKGRGKTLLSEAVSQGSIECVNVLLLNGADVNLIDGWGRTPLAWAGKQSDPRIIKALIGAGANQEPNGRSILFDYAAQDTKDSKNLAEPAAFEEIIGGMKPEKVREKHLGVTALEAFIDTYVRNDGFLGGIRHQKAEWNQGDLHRVLRAFIAKDRGFLLDKDLWSRNNLAETTLFLASSQNTGKVMTPARLTINVISAAGGVTGEMPWALDFNDDYKKAAFGLYHGLIKSEHAVKHKCINAILKDTGNPLARWWELSDTYGNNPLHHSAQKGDADLAMELVASLKKAARADGVTWLDGELHKQNKWGWSALHSAASAGNSFLVGRLKEEGPIRDGEDADGKTADEILHEQIARTQGPKPLSRMAPMVLRNSREDKII